MTVPRRSSREIVALRSIATLCLNGSTIERKPVMLGSLEKEIQDYVVEVLAQQRLVVIKKGMIYPSKKLCELYKTYLDCYNDIERRCAVVSPFVLRKCWVEQWYGCLGILP